MSAELMVLMLPRFRSIVVVISVLALLTGIMLLLYGRWSGPLAAAARALEGRQIDQALEAYGVANGRFREWPVTRRVAAGDHAMAAHNELALLYELRRYDEVIEGAATAPPEAAPHFWAGCALFKKAAYEETTEKQLEWLTRAEDEFKLALGDAPDDWDAKFNYELSARLSAALRPAPKSGTQQKKVPSNLMRLLRPNEDEQRQQRPVKKIG